MFCGECGSKQENPAKFCGECGSAMIASAETASHDTSAQHAPHQVAGDAGAHILRFVLKYKTGLRNLALILIFFFLIQFLITSNQNSPVKALKDIVFEQHSSVAFGDVVKLRVDNAKWDSTKVAEKHHQVSLRGFLKEYQTNFTLVFDVTYSGEWIYAKPLSVTMHGETYTDWLDIILFFGMLYG